MTWLAVLTQQPVSLHSLRPELPTHITRAIDRALSKERTEQVENVQAFRKALHEEIRSVKEELPTVPIESSPALPTATVSYTTVEAVALPLVASVAPTQQRRPIIAVGVATMIALTIAISSVLFREKAIEHTVLSPPIARTATAPVIERPAATTTIATVPTPVATQDAGTPAVSVPVGTGANETHGNNTETRQ